MLTPTRHGSTTLADGRTLAWSEQGPADGSVAENPAGAEAYFAQLTADRLYAMSLELAAAIDRPIYEQPAFAAAFRSALENGFAQGAGGYARDAVLAFGRWPFDVSSIEVPVELFYGTGDTSPVHSPDRMATLASRIPSARRHLIDGGGAILWTHTAEILTALRSR